MTSLLRTLLPGLMLWTVMLMPVLGSLAHGSFAHAGTGVVAMPSGLHQHAHGNDHHHDETETMEVERLHEHGADHSHDPGKMLPSIVLPGVIVATLWLACYQFSLTAPPIAPFERPPKSRLV